MKRTTLILISLLLISACSLTGNVTNVPGKCQDSDAGWQTDVAGWVDITQSDGSTQRFEDACKTDNTQLREYTCKDDGEEWPKTFDCPYGCAQGACLSEGEELQDTSSTGIIPVADTSIKIHNTDRNYGDDDTVVSDGDPLRHILLAFDISGYDTIQSAYLEVIPVLSRKVDKRVVMVEEPWDEMTVTWDTRPAFGDVIGSLSGEVTEGERVQIPLDVSHMQGDLFSIAIQDVSEGYTLKFNSREYDPATAARLVVSTATQPDCGNDVLESGEQCDGSSMAGQTCVTRGYDGGILRCTDVCTFDESSCVTIDSYCGDGMCDAEEDCGSCSADCGSCEEPPADSYCGDSVCDADETCDSCPGDCGDCPVVDYCGDGVCSADEDCDSCSADCGECTVQPVCGDGVCADTEFCSNCAEDCGSCPVVVSQGIWTSSDELADKPMTGAAWDTVKDAADSLASSPTPDVADQDDNTNVDVLAAAIVYARTGDAVYKEKVEHALDHLVSQGHPGGRTLAWGRETGAYALAADLIGYRTPEFETYLRNIAEVWEGTQIEKPLLGMYKQRPNNWGSQAFGSLTAIYAYLGDDAGLEEVRDYWIRSLEGPKPPEAKYGSDTSWHCDESDLRWINPACTKVCQGQTVNIGGIIPDDMRRGASCRPSPEDTGYPWEGMQGMVMAYRILERKGMSVWDAGDAALCRSASAMQDGRFGDGWKAEGDDRWQLPFLDAGCGTSWSLDRDDVWGSGKNTGWGYVLTEGQQATCGDNVCSLSETCSTCSADCGECEQQPYCGDAVCDADESCSTCSADCGECEEPGPYCGDSTCDADEDCESCSADCGECEAAPYCGDNTCDADETCSTCSQDCGPCPPEPVCEVEDVYWFDTQALEGQSVVLVVEATGCEGQQVSFAVYEQDIFDSNDPVVTNPASVIIDEVQASSTWTAEYQADCAGLCNPPEYIFHAEIGGETYISSNLLVVQRAAEEEPYCGDASCDPDESCSTCSADCGVCGEPSSDLMWMPRSELMQLPTSGAAWEQLVDYADADAGTPHLCDQDQMNNVHVLAKALVFARQGTETYRQEVRQQLGAAVGSEVGSSSDCGGREPRTLALGRELAAYVMAADLIDLEQYDPTFDSNVFRPWLRSLLTKELDGRTLVSTHEDRPNNWGTHAGASRIAVAIYLEDQNELDRAADVFRGWAGDRSAYADFSYGDLAWQCDADAPVGINPAGCTKIDQQGISRDLDGAQPEEVRRKNDDFTWPPTYTGYVWGGLEGAVVQAELLTRQGYDAWEWEDRALCRAAEWIHDRHVESGGWWAEGDDAWQPWIINARCGTDYPADLPARPGKNMGYTDWTHG